MNLRRYFLFPLLLSCLLLDLFSISSYASETETIHKLSFFGTEYDLVTDMNGGIALADTVIEGEIIEPTAQYSYYDDSGNRVYWAADNGGVGPLTANKNYTVCIAITLPEVIPKGTPFNFQIGLTGYSGGQTFDYVTFLGKYSGYKKYTDLKSSAYYNCESNSDVSCDFDIYTVEIWMTVKTLDSGWFNTVVSTAEFNEVSETGLLGNLIELVRNLKVNVESIVTSIIELPQRIWDLISEGLKGLFIPSEEDITSQQDKWNALLEDRFGALYQVVDLIHDYAETFADPGEKGTVEFPGITVNLAGSDFVFGGQEVDVVPDGFEFLIDVIKTIISILATTLFINGMKNRFEKLIGGSDNI